MDKNYALLVNLSGKEKVEAKIFTSEQLDILWKHKEEEMPPIMIDHGKGVYLYGRDGKEYIDIVSSWWCNLLGHCNPTINAAVKEQIDRPEHVIFANLSHEPAVRLCEELEAIVPEGLTKFNFSDNGSAAVECALKMAFQYGCA